MRALAEQSGGLVRLEDLRPASAEHPRCSFSATFERTAGGGLRPARAAACCCTPRPGAGAQAARKAVARRWVHPGGEGPAAPAGEGSGTASLDAFLEQAGRRAFSLSGMAFQDAWTLDLQRLRECHVHVAAAGRLVPFCAFNLTSQAGAALHRESRGEPCRCAP